MQENARQAYLDSMKAVKADAFENQVTGQNTSCDKSLGMRPIRMQISEDDLGLFYQVDDVAQRVVDKIVDDAIQGGFSLSPNHGPRYEWFWREFYRLGMMEKISLAWKWARLYGDSIIMLNIDDGQSPEMPVDMDRIKSIRWAHVLDMTDYAVGSIGRDPSSAYFRKPESFQIRSVGEASSAADKKGNGAILFDIHASRCIQFSGKVIPWTQFQNNDYFHESVLQPVYKHATNYDSANEAIAKVMPELRQQIMKIPGLMEIAASGGEQLRALENRLFAMERYRSVHRAVMIDSEEEMTTSILQLSGVESVLRSLADRLVQSSSMPHTIVLGEGSEGNTSGRSEKEEWYKTVSTAQTDYLLPRLEMIRDFVFAQSGSPAPEMEEDGRPKIEEFRFAPLSMPTETEKASTYKTIAEADAIYVEMGVLTAPEIAKSRFSDDGFQSEVYIDDDRLMEMQQAFDDLKGLAQNGNANDPENDESRTQE